MKRISTVIVFVLLLSLAFACRGGALGMSFLMSHDMSAHGGSHDMPCCDVAEESAVAIEHDFSVFSLPSAGALLGLFAVAIILSFGVVVVRKFIIPPAQIIAWRQYIPLTQLFKRGILHPKTW